MHFHLVALAALLAVSSATPAPKPDVNVIVLAVNPPSTLQQTLSRTCGKKNGPCDENGCEGINNQNGSPGICQAGPYAGCPCASVCGNKVNSCADNGCEGKNNPSTGLGVCTSGDYNGCACAGTCNNSINSCSSNGCEGVDGFCTAGKYNGCPCKE